MAAGYRAGVAERGPSARWRKARIGVMAGGLTVRSWGETDWLWIW